LAPDRLAKGGERGGHEVRAHHTRAAHFVGATSFPGRSRAASYLEAEGVGEVDRGEQRAELVEPVAPSRADLEDEVDLRGSRLHQRFRWSRHRAALEASAPTPAAPRGAAAASEPSASSPRSPASSANSAGA